MCGTKTQTTSDTKQATTFNYDPAAKKVYDSSIQNAFGLYTGWANQPFNNMSFQQDVTTGTDMAAKLGQRGINNITQNARAGGYGDMALPGFQASMLNRAGRATGAMQGQAIRQAITNANQRQMYATGEMAHFQPLMTGTNTTGHSDTTQQTSGAGTWAPQLMGAVAGGAMSALTGGLMGGKGGGAAGGGGDAGGFSPGFMGSSPGGNFNNSYWGFSGYQSPMQSMNMPFSGANPFTG